MDESYWGRENENRSERNGNGRDQEKKDGLLLFARELETTGRPGDNKRQIKPLVIIILNQDQDAAGPGTLPQGLPSALHSGHS